MALLQLPPEDACPQGDPELPTRGYPLLLATQRFITVHDCFDVWLCHSNRDPVSVGTHYDEPRAVVYSRRGAWLATGGCGVVIYHLRNPYLSFESGVESDQWWEIGRDEDDPWLVDRMRLIDEDHLRVVVDPESLHGGVYDVGVTQLTIRPGGHRKMR